ncbi:MAG TPA: hypothetical protein VIS95_10320 [Solirubrobacterales bacterium]
MKLMVKIALVTGALALACGGAALAAQPEGVPKGKGPTYTPADPPKGGPASKGNAYGYHCKGESKKHVEGEKGTAFSRCVKNMAQAAKQKSKAPGQICKGESRKHVKGEKGTAFSRCVKAVNALRKEERQKEKEAATA